MSEANKELVRRHFEEIFSRKNLAVCDEIMAEDFVEHARKRRFVAGTVPGFAHDDRSGDLERAYRGRKHPLGGHEPPESTLKPIRATGFGSLKASLSSTATTRDALTAMMQLGVL